MTVWPSALPSSDDRAPTEADFAEAMTRCDSDYLEPEYIDGGPAKVQSRQKGEK